MTSVLVVDDEAAVREVLATLVEREGWTPSTAATGEEALARLERVEPDAVLLDLMLPAMSGLEVLRQIHRRFPERLDRPQPRPAGLPS